MVKKYRSVYMILIDMDLTLCAYALTILINNNFFINTSIDLSNIGFNLIGLLPLYLLLQYLILKIMHVYPSVWRQISIKDIGLLALGLSINALVISLITLMTDRSSLISFILNTSILSFLLMSAVRIGYRQYTNNLLFTNKNLVKSVIIGAGQGGDLLYKELTSNPAHNTKVIGFIDDNKSKVGWHLHGLSVLGTTDDLDYIKAKYKIERVYYAIPSVKNATNQQY